jgi:hypothetical protein
MIVQEDAQSVNATNPNSAASPEAPPTREYAFNMPPLGEKFDRLEGQSTPADAPPAGQSQPSAWFSADEGKSYHSQMVLGQGRAADAPRPEDMPASPDGQWAGFEPQQVEMTQDMLDLLRASRRPPVNKPINSVEDLLEVVHALPVVELFRRMKHLKASWIRRMLDSRKFREHMELRRRLAWEKCATEAAVTSPAAVDRLYRLTMCEKPETARKSCMALIRMGLAVDRGAGDRKTGDRGTVGGQGSKMGATLKRSEAELGGVFGPDQHPQGY